MQVNRKKNREFCELVRVAMSYHRYSKIQYVWVTPSVRSRWLDIGQVFFFACLSDRDEVIHKLAKKERGQYPAILTEQTWSIKELLYGFRGHYSCGTRRVVPGGQDGSILPARVANHSEDLLHLARSPS